MTSPFKLPEHIDSTMMTCFRSCPQKFALEFGHGFRPPGISVDLHAGGCFASAIEATYRGVHEMKLSFGDALARAHLVFVREWGDFQIPDYKRTAKTFDRVWEAVEAYFDHWPILTDHIQPYFDASGKATFEYTFAIPLEPAAQHHQGNPDDGIYEVYEPNHPLNKGLFPCHPSGAPFLYTGRFDMLGAYSGKPVWRDEKSTGASLTASWADKWALRSQFMGYTWACQQAGLDLDTGVCRGISILKTKIDFAEAILQYPPHLIDRWYEQLRQDLWRMRRSYDAGYFDYNLGDSCTAYGNCIFLTPCQAVDGSVWHNEYEVRHWNPLNKNPVQP